MVPLCQKVWPTPYIYAHNETPAWCNSHIIISRTNKVALWRSCLVTGWVTVIGRHTTLVSLPSHPGQLSLLPSAGPEMNICQRVVMLCIWGVMQAFSRTNSSVQTKTQIRVSILYDHKFLLTNIIDILGIASSE